MCCNSWVRGVVGKKRNIGRNADKDEDEDEVNWMRDVVVCVCHALFAVCI